MSIYVSAFGITLSDDELRKAQARDARAFREHPTAEERYAKRQCDRWGHRVVREGEDDFVEICIRAGCWHRVSW